MFRIAIVLAAVAALALSAAPAAAKRHERTLTIKARSQLDQVQAVDNAPAGASAGDMLIFTERLFDLSGKRIGSDAATCAASSTRPRSAPASTGSRAGV